MELRIKNSNRPQPTPPLEVDVSGGGTLSFDTNGNPAVGGSIIGSNNNARLGFYGSTPGVQPTVDTGGTTAETLASLISELQRIGLVTT